MLLSRARERDALYRLFRVRTALQRRSHARALGERLHGLAREAVTRKHALPRTETGRYSGRRRAPARTLSRLARRPCPALLRRRRRPGAGRPSPGRAQARPTTGSAGDLASPGSSRERSGSPPVHSADPSTGLSTPPANPLNPFLLPAFKHNDPQTFHSQTDILTTARNHYPSWSRRSGPLNLGRTLLDPPMPPTQDRTPRGRHRT